MDASESTQFWVNFFGEAGIPTSEARNHAVSFTRHRIQVEMLPDLNKEYLNDMGITMMGDIIAILKHAKNVAQQTSREEALKALAVERPRTPPRRSTAASRTVAHYLPRDDNSGPMNEAMISTPKISQELASRLGPVNDINPKAKVIVTRTASPVMSTRLSSNKLKQTRTTSPMLIKLDIKKQKEVVPVPKVRRVLPEHEGKYKIKMPAGTTEKTRKILEKQLQSELEASSSKSSSVFDRLGQSDSPEPLGRGFKVTGLDKIVIHKELGSSQDSSVFGRLGGSVLKRPATSTVPDSSDTEEDGDGLEYHGVLKHSPMKKKKIIRTTIKKTIVRVEPPKKKKVPTATLR